MARFFTLVVLLWFGPALSARAQEAASDLAVPPPPGGNTAPTVVAPTAPALSTQQAPTDMIVAPLLEAAERDLAHGRPVLAFARAALVSHALPEHRPLRIRADGLLLLARPRIGDDPTSPGLDEVLSPLVAQAELDIRGQRTLVAMQRLEFALARLPLGSVLRVRAERLRRISYGSMGAGGPPSTPVGYGSTHMNAAPPPELPPRDPDRRGGAEMAELYVSASGLGALTGGFIPFAASGGTAGSTTYTITIIGGAGLFALGVGALDLSGALQTGMAPTISSSIRIGVTNGLLGFGLAGWAGLDDTGARLGLAWGGSAIGAVVGLGVAFGLRPRVPEARLVESVGLWGAGLGTSFGMLAEDAGVAVGLTLAGLDVGILAGVGALASGARMPVGRTLMLDLGFLAGYGVGIGLPLAYHLLSRTNVDALGLGAGSLLGSVGGWLLLFLLTDGWQVEDDDERPEDPRYTLGISPVEGGATVSFSGRL